MALDLSPLQTFLAGIRSQDPYQGHTFAQYYQPVQQMVQNDADNLQARQIISNAAMPNAFRRDVSGLMTSQLQNDGKLNIPLVAAQAAKYDPNAAFEMMKSYDALNKPIAQKAREQANQVEVAKQGLANIEQYPDWYMQVTSVYPETVMYLPKNEIGKNAVIVALKIMAGIKDAPLESDKMIGKADLYGRALGAFESGTYSDFYYDHALSDFDRKALPKPDVATKQIMETLAQGSQAAGATLQNTIDMSGKKNQIMTQEVLQAKAKTPQEIERQLQAEASIGGLQPPKPEDSMNGTIRYKYVPEAYKETIDSARNSYSKLKTASNEVAQSVNAILETIKNHKTDQGELQSFPLISVITQYNKMIDPGAVVRESDVALATGAGGLVGQLISLLGMFKSSKTMPEPQVNELVKLANETISRLEATKLASIKSYGSVAKNTGVDPFWVLQNDADKSSFYKNSGKNASDRVQFKDGSFGVWNGFNYVPEGK